MTFYQHRRSFDNFAEACGVWDAPDDAEVPAPLFTSSFDWCLCLVRHAKGFLTATIDVVRGGV